MEMTTLGLAVLVGIGHAFEADHLVAVSSIVTRRNNIVLALKDGIYWGIGHTFTILLVGLVFLLGKYALDTPLFQYFEAGVGLMLVLLGFVRLLNLKNSGSGKVVAHAHTHQHKVAYGIGMVHGLAGSGALLISVLATSSDPVNSMAYLCIFGLGSILGMMVAAGVFSIPFSDKILKNETLRVVLTVLSAVLCIGLGSFVIYENLV